MYAGRVDEALHDTVAVVVFGGNPKQFGLRYDLADFLGRDALILGPADSMTGIAERLGPYFDSVHELAPFTLGRSGMQETPMRLMRARCLLKLLPSPYRQPSYEARPAGARGRCLGHEPGNSDLSPGIR
jgi:hypothetical protein